MTERDFHQIEGSGKFKYRQIVSQFLADWTRAVVPYLLVKTVTLASGSFPNGSYGVSVLTSVFTGSFLTLAFFLPEK